MMEALTQPDVDEPVADDEPDAADVAGVVKPEAGISLGAGIVIGAVVGVLGAVATALWFGFQGPAASLDEASALDVTASSPAERPGDPTPERPATGTDIVRPAKTGGGTLILQNIGNLDAVVVLADEATFARAVYVRTDERVTIPDVAAGTYDILMMLGRDWSADHFAQAATYQQLDQPIEFAERDTGSGAEYTRLTVSIEPVTAGLIGVRQTERFQLTAR